MPTIADYLKYADLQMAAEAFILDPATGEFRSSGDRLVAALIRGNDHASIFTATQATAFAAHWVAVDQCANTSTGFSGTLFRCVQDDPNTGAKAGDLVMSFRSTEFIDDATRDNQATNTLEIKEHGFAFGQIADMEAWYADLRQRGLIPPGTQVSVTGYSLGGHLATAFNLLHAGEGVIKEVVTFNGAGVGTYDLNTNLNVLLAQFNQRRADYSSFITDSQLLGVYVRVRADLAAGRSITSSDRDELRAIAAATNNDLNVNAATRATAQRVLALSRASRAHGRQGVTWPVIAVRRAQVDARARRFRRVLGHRNGWEDRIIFKAIQIQFGRTKPRSSS